MSSSESPVAKRSRTSLLLGPALLSVAVGALVGLGLYTFGYAKGLSYFSTAPSACANCHIMNAQYDSYQKASHHTVAVCVDCHLPQAFLPKYLAKAENGWRHGKLFTTGGFKEPIEVQPAGREILEENCVRCHGAITAEMRLHGTEPRDPEHAPGIACLHCHPTVGHGARAGLGGPLTASELRQIERISAARAETNPARPSNAGETRSEGAP